MKTTNIIEKIIPSAIMAGISFLISLPLLWFLRFGLAYKIFLVLIFFILSIIFLFIPEGRDPGMQLIGSSWEKRYLPWQKIVYSIFYSLSFATLLFWFIIPFGLFILNMVFLQLPCVILTGTTLHGFLSGGMRTIKNAR